ncbi:MAG: hypothetical protein V6Z89_19740 [Desulfobacter sp.]
MNGLKNAMIDAAVNHAKTVVVMLAAATLAAGAFLPLVEIDTDPENMLEQSEPARAITRNVMVIAVGFLPLVLARLVPYRITGLMLFAILSVSGIITLAALPAILGLWESTFFKSPVRTPNITPPVKET